MIDPTNPVVALCAAGMAVEGDAVEARRLFDQAWAARRDDFDACIAAHFIARHQDTPADALRWHALAVRHAEAAEARRVAPLLASLYLNLGDAHASVGEREQAATAVARAAAHLGVLPEDGYREFVAMGIRRLTERLSDRGAPDEPAIARDDADAATRR